MLKDILYSGDSVNILLFHAINNIQASCFQQVMQAVTIMGKYTLFPVYLFVIAGFAWQYGNAVKARDAGEYRAYANNIKQLIISLILSYIVYIAWVSGLKHLLHMPRPFAILPEGTVFVRDSIKNAEEPFASMPSGHAAFSVMMLVSLWSMLTTIEKTAGIALVLMIGISRIALGVHFPIDILTSWIISFAVTWGTLKFAKKLFSKRFGLMK